MLEGEASCYSCLPLSTASILHTRNYHALADELPFSQGEPGKYVQKIRLYTLGDRDSVKVSNLIPASSYGDSINEHTEASEHGS